MEIETFQPSHIKHAGDLIRQNYLEEKECVTHLPATIPFPDLGFFTENGLGIVATEGNILLGFLCCLGPFNNLFGEVKGCFSPLHAHGFIKNGRKNIASRIYQQAAEQWVHKGIVSHAITLYAHDTDTIESFFWNGFGLRCIDAVCQTNLVFDSSSSFSFKELTPDALDDSTLFELENATAVHLNKSPSFQPYAPLSKEKWQEKIRNSKPRIFVALYEDVIIGYIKIKPTGENFVTRDPDMMNICGAHLKASYRGRHIFDNLLAYVIKTLKNEGYLRVGVDFESFNPTAKGFWMKYCTPYTYSLARRIDERILLER